MIIKPQRQMDVDSSGILFCLFFSSSVQFSFASFFFLLLNFYRFFCSFLLLTPFLSTSAILAHFLHLRHSFSPNQPLSGFCCTHRHKHVLCGRENEWVAGTKCKKYIIVPSRSSLNLSVLLQHVLFFAACVFFPLQ